MKLTFKPASIRTFLLLLLAVHGATAYAQDEWTEARDGIRSLYHSVGTLLTVVMMIGALVVLVMICTRIMNGDRESATKLAWWLMGLCFGLAMMAFLMS